MSFEPAPGSWLIFGIILVPVYAAILGWFLGYPRDTKIATMGLSYLVGIVLAMWIPMYILTVIIGLVFF